MYFLRLLNPYLGTSVAVTIIIVLQSTLHFNNDQLSSEVECWSLDPEVLGSNPGGDFLVKFQLKKFRFHI